jgi:hypothetical protein
MGGEAALEREERVAKTESLFRDVNERIVEATERFDADEAELMCECADPACAERLEVSLEEYERVRSDGTHFLLDPEHVEPTVERIVRKRAEYAVVEKFGKVAARVVQQLDPRAEPA